MIIAEHSSTTHLTSPGPAPVETYISSLLSQPLPVVEYTLDMKDEDWPAGVEQMEREISEAERRFSRASSSSSSSSSGDVFMASQEPGVRADTSDRDRAASLPSPGLGPAPQLAKVSQASSSGDVFEVECHHSGAGAAVLRAPSSSSSSSEAAADIKADSRSSSSSSDTGAEVRPTRTR